MKGTASVHPLGARALRALRRLQCEMPEGVRNVYIFVSERLAPLSVAGYQRMVARAGEAAGFPFLVQSHMLRHSCGYKLANDGQDTRAIQHYLGHRSITLDGPLHRLGTRSVQRILEGLAGRTLTRLHRNLWPCLKWVKALEDNASCASR
jgi:site-specific recombinase XerD